MLCVAMSLKISTAANDAVLWIETVADGFLWIGHLPPAAWYGAKL